MRRLAALLTSIFAFPLAAFSQYELIAIDHGANVVVGAAWKDQACVLKDGKPVPLYAKNLVLREAPDYLPVYVDIANLNIGATSNDVGGKSMNTDFHFGGALRSSRPLDNVFIALSITPELGDSMVFVNDVGHLDANVSRTVSMHIPLDVDIGSGGSYRVHLFSGGVEVLQSSMNFAELSNALDRMVSKRLEGVDSADPKFFIGANPTYPKALRKANKEGHVVVTVRIAFNGRVLDPVVKSASDPEFAKAFVFAVQDWRYLPKMVHGHPVETELEVPYDFAAPKPNHVG